MRSRISLIGVVQISGSISHWAPCPIELIEQVIDHFTTTDYSRGLESLLSSRVQLFSQKYIVLLENIAKHSNDPKSNKLNIYRTGHSDQLDEISSKDLFGNTINCTRGRAYRSIAQKFWEDQEYAVSHKYIIENALKDGWCFKKYAEKKQVGF